MGLNGKRPTIILVKVYLINLLRCILVFLFMTLDRPCSLDGSFEQVDIVPGSLPSPAVDLTLGETSSERRAPLQEEQFKSMLDQDGRLVNEHQLRQAVFLGWC